MARDGSPIPPAGTRLVVLDPRIGQPSNGVDVVHPWLAELDPEDALAVTVDDGENLRLVDRPGGSSQGHPADVDEVVAALDAHQPDLVVFCAGPGAIPLVTVAERLIRSDVPVVLLVEDQWYLDLLDSWPDRGRFWDGTLASVARRSSAVFASSDLLASQLSETWGVDVGTWVVGSPVDARPAPMGVQSERLRLACAPDPAPGYGIASTMLVGLAVHQAPNVTLALRSQARGEGNSVADALATLNGVSATAPGQRPPALADHYADADIVVFCQDFSAGRSQQPAIPGAVPALLASGRPVLAVGPAGNAAIEYLRGTGAALVVDTPEPARITWCLQQFADPEARQKMGANAGLAHHALRGQRPDLRVVVESRPDRREGGPLGSIRARHAGQRCVIVGNGPSLRQTDLGLLDNEIMFASNGIHLLFDEVKWRPTYYAAVDPLYLHERHDDIRTLLDAHPDTTGVFPTHVPMHDDSGATVRPPDLLPDIPNAVFVDPLGEMSHHSPFGAFSVDLAAGLVQPATVTIALMQIAAHLGFTEMILVGCDTSYTIPDTVDRSGPDVPGSDGEKLIITSTADDDPNHFAADYFGQGRSWHHPRVDNMIRHYRLAHDVLRMLGVSVVNATEGGALEVFPRLPLAEALSDPTSTAT